MPETNPLISGRNFVPSSTELGSPSSSGAGGTVAALQMLQGHERDAVTLTVTPAEGASMLPLSSKPRLLIVTLPTPATVPLNVQEVVPVAAAQVAPPSIETSTPTRTPPPFSVAVPVTVTAAPDENVAPETGDEMV